MHQCIYERNYSRHQQLHRIKNYLYYQWYQIMKFSLQRNLVSNTERRNRDAKQ